MKSVYDYIYYKEKINEDEDVLISIASSFYEDLIFLKHINLLASQTKIIWKYERRKFVESGNAGWDHGWINDDRIFMQKKGYHS